MMCSVMLVLPNSIENRDLNFCKIGVRAGWTSTGMSTVVGLVPVHAVGIACGSSSSRVIMWHEEACVGCNCRTSSGFSVL